MLVFLLLVHPCSWCALVYELALLHLFASFALPARPFQQRCNLGTLVVLLLLPVVSMSLFIFLPCLLGSSTACYPVFHRAEQNERMPTRAQGICNSLFE